ALVSMSCLEGVVVPELSPEGTPVSKPNSKRDSVYKGIPESLEVHKCPPWVTPTFSSAVIWQPLRSPSVLYLLPLYIGVTTRGPLSRTPPQPVNPATPPWLLASSSLLLPRPSYASGLHSSSLRLHLDPL
ncbi:hypothetical protein M9458_008908, partial [Cirrhinus mrigala]